ncbi:hypothetical protein GCM10022409_33650 [Hymenobacter glaciei]|uniref:Pentapeptide MXKDX repeat protein n=1 Tax=Hymenobacter glaciei TaxID=877209 RepID=A0ABP7UJ63_9BACT
MLSSNLSGLIVTLRHFTSTTTKNLLKLAVATALSLTFVAAQAQQGNGKMMKKDEKAGGKMMKKSGQTMSNDKAMKKTGKTMKYDAKMDAKMESKDEM